MYANSGYPNKTPHSSASDLGLHCLSMSHKKGARLICVLTHMLTYMCLLLSDTFSAFVFLHASSMGSGEYVLAWAFVN